jgi:hypothetical protein
MLEKNKKYIFVFFFVIALIIIIYNLNQIVVFKDKEFERLVRETMLYDNVTNEEKRDEPIVGIIWKKDLYNIERISIDFREYRVKDISDLKKFKNLRFLALGYPSAYDGDTSLYEDRHVLDKMYEIEKLKKLEWIYIYNLKVNEDIKAMFPNAEVFIN